MLTILPVILSFLFTAGLFYLRPYANKAGWREAALCAAVVLGVLLTAMTESFSLFSVLRFGWVAVAWACVAAISGILFAGELAGHPVPPLHRLGCGKDAVLMLGGVSIYIAGTGLIAAISPPNNYDSMVYHMVRVAHWVQNHSVSPYPANYLHNLSFPPWAEFAITHLQVLSRSDRFANLVQWSSMIGSVAGVSLIAKKLGGDLRCQIAAAVICVTIPMGILQASSTQNDYAASLWLVCLVYCILRAYCTGITWPVAAFAGASAGLALLTKATAYFIVPPLLAWFAYIAVRQLRGRAWKIIALVAAVALTLNLGYYVRNFELFGLPTPVGTKDSVMIHFRPDFFLSNLLKNCAIHLTTPSPMVNRFVEHGIGFIHGALGVNAGDPRTTLFNPEISGFRLIPRLLHEDFAVNSLHLLLVFLSFALFLGSARVREERPLRQYLYALTISFCLFCAFLKWQVFISRLQLPFFVLFSPIISIVLSRSFKAKAVTAVPAILLCASLPWLLCNSTRPLIGKHTVFNTPRDELYFANRPFLLTPSVEAADFIRSRNCKDLGIYMRADGWEYPFWALLKEGGRQDARIEDVGMMNISKAGFDSPPFSGFDPCAIISIDDNPTRIVTFGQHIYTRSFSKGSVNVFTRAN